MNNPFEFGDPVQNEHFYNRRRELRRLTTRIRKGSSASITAEPRFGKTSLMYEVQSSAYYGEEYTKLYFHYIDPYTFQGWDAARFWEHALDIVSELSPEIRNAYLSARREKFAAFVLERFFKHLEESGLRLVLLLDEFDKMLDEPSLHTAEFYGAMRTIASRYSSLSLIIAARQPVRELNERTQKFSNLGSPYFNFLEEMNLNAFPLKDSQALLKQAGERFSKNDKDFLEFVSGRIPYFLQVTASYLWDTYEDREEGEEDTEEDAISRRKRAGVDAFNQTNHVLKDIWRTWSAHKKMAFTLAALDEIPRLLPNHNFSINDLLKDLPDFSPEQRILKERGFLYEDSQLEGGYAVQSEIMLWFLAEELTRLLRPQDPDIGTWLRTQEWDGLLKQGEQDKLRNAVLAVKPFVKEGALAFIKAAAEGFGKGITGG